MPDGTAKYRGQLAGGHLWGVEQREGLSARERSSVIFDEMFKSRAPSMVSDALKQDILAFVNTVAEPKGIVVDTCTAAVAARVQSYYLPTAHARDEAVKRSDLNRSGPAGGLPLPQDLGWPAAQNRHVFWQKHVDDKLSPAEPVDPVAVQRVVSHRQQPMAAVPAVCPSRGRGVVGQHQRFQGRDGPGEHSFVANSGHPNGFVQHSGGEGCRCG